MKNNISPKNPMGGGCYTNRDFVSELGNKVQFPFSHNFSKEMQFKKKFAFTLAEVLITFGIIGIVAALTIPGMIKHHKKVIIETRLAKFYSCMNQALKLSSVQYGDFKDWQFPEDETYENLYSWYERYLKKNLKVMRDEQVSRPGLDYPVIRLYFADGSVADIGWHGKDYRFCINEKEQQRKDSGDTQYGAGCFLFGFYPNTKSTNPCIYEEYANKGIEPYLHNTATCTSKDWYTQNPAKWIQMNGWKIPKDYESKYKI